MISSSQRPLPDNTRHSHSAGERPAAARLLRSWVRIPPGAWIFVCCECRVLSGRGLCDELITRPEESYRLCCVVVCDLETSRMGAPYIYDISRLRVNIIFVTQNRPTNDRLKFGGCTGFWQKCRQIETAIERKDLRSSTITNSYFKITQPLRKPSGHSIWVNVTHLFLNKRPMYACGWTTTATQLQVNKFNHTSSSRCLTS